MPEGVREPSWPRTLPRLFDGPPPAPQPGAVTLAVLPDPQYYAACSSPHLAAQARWVLHQASSRNIVATLTLGDLTEHNTELEWAYVRRALRPLAETVPVILATGNHDHGEGGRSDQRGTRLQDAFPAPLPATAPVLAELRHAGDLENAYYRLQLSRVTLGILVLEWSPRDRVVTWANEVLEKYAGDRSIVITHAYVYYDGSRYDFRAHGASQRWNPKSYGTALADVAKLPGADNWHPEGANDGQDLWDKLVRAHPGVFLTLSGHVLGDGAGVLSSRGDAGNLVQQVLVNFQMLDEGGLGFLRLVELSPDGAELRFTTYSPTVDRSSRAEDQEFSLPIEPPLY